VDAVLQFVRNEFANSLAAALLKDCCIFLCSSDYIFTPLQRG
jgi:hypothetical protein